MKIVSGICLILILVACKSKPAIATVKKQFLVKKMEQGDISCYVFVQDKNRQGYPADFDLCIDQHKYVGKLVNFTFEKSMVSACEGSQECNKSYEVLMIKKMEPVEEKAR